MWAVIFCFGAGESYYRVGQSKGNAVDILFSPFLTSCPLAPHDSPIYTMDFLQLLVGLTLLSYVFDTYLGQRQLAKLRHSAPPATLQAYFSLLGDSSNFLPSQNYLSDKLRFGQVAGLVDLVESAATYTTLLSIVSAKAIPVSGLKAIWDYAGTYELVIHRGEIAQSLAFAVLVAAASMITSVPASLYRTFVSRSGARIFSR